jgi:hypothetical protein
MGKGKHNGIAARRRKPLAHLGSNPCDRAVAVFALPVPDIDAETLEARRWVYILALSAPTVAPAETGSFTVHFAGSHLAMRAALSAKRSEAGRKPISRETRCRMQQRGPSEQRTEFHPWDTAR